MNLDQKAAELAKLALLAKIVRTGQYPAGMTAADLAAVPIGTGETALSLAAIWGHYPAATTALDLARVKTLTGETVLHIAAAEGHLPPGTTVHDLMDAVSDSGRTALDAAAMVGHYPAGTTLRHLAQAAGDTGHNALETALFWGNLPQSTTESDLRSTMTKPGVSAWDRMVDGLARPGRLAEDAIAVRYIYQFPGLIMHLHPATSEPHRDLVLTLLADGQLPPQMHQMLAANPEILAMML